MHITETETLNKPNASKQTIKKTESINHSEAFQELHDAVFSALETYSNVHRGSGYNSMATTFLFDKAREIVSEYLKTDSKKYVTIFCNLRNFENIKQQLDKSEYKFVSSSEIGLPLGVWAIAVKKKLLTKLKPLYVGGGTARLVAKDWVIWERNAEKFEAGTPAIVNIIAFAKALTLIEKYRNDAFSGKSNLKQTNAHSFLFNDELLNLNGDELIDRLRKLLIGYNKTIQTTTGQKTFINFDNGASTPTFVPIWNTVWNIWQKPEILHKEVIPEVKNICSKFLNAPESIFDIFFTSNTTEAINLVAENLSFTNNKDIEPVVLNTYLEHNSNELPWRNISGHKNFQLSVDSDGFINLTELETTLKAYNKDCIYGNKRITLVSITGASNVMGSYNNIEEIGKIVHNYQAQLMIDAAQLIAHKKIDMLHCNIDYLAFSAHKAYAPFGTGVLIGKKEILKFPQSIMQQIIKSGEANIGGIAALGKALLLLEKIGMQTIAYNEQILTSYVLDGLAKIKNINVFGIKQILNSEKEKKGGVIVFIEKNRMPSKTANYLAFNEGIGVRFGCHCAHMMVKKIHNIGPRLEKFQGFITRLFPKMKLPGVVRVSFGLYNTIAEADTFLKAIENRDISKKENSNRKISKKEIIEIIKQETKEILN